MSQYSYTKKPNWLGDGSRNMMQSSMTSMQGTIIPTYKGWMSPMAGIGAATATSMVWSASVVTVTTSSPHKLVSGKYTMITGATPVAYNGYFPVTVVSPTSFTYPLTSNPGTALIAKTVTAQSWYNGVLTLTIPSHGLQASNLQSLFAGFTPSLLNGTVEVSVIDENTIRTSLPTNPNITVLGTVAAQASIYVEAEVLVSIGQLNELYIDASIVPTFSAAISYSGTSNTVTGDIITVTVTASEPVIITGNPYITLTINGINKRFAYDGTNSTTTSLIFTYTVLAANSAIVGQFVVGSSITGQVGIGDILTPNGTVSGALNPIASTTFTTIDTTLTTVN